MTAIALAESGGKSGAHNTTCPDNSYGLWQINMLDEPGYMLGEERRNYLDLNQMMNCSILLKTLRQLCHSQTIRLVLGLYIPIVVTSSFSCYKKAASGPRTNTTVISQIDSNTRYKAGQDVTQLLGGEVGATVTSTRGMQESLEQIHTVVLTLVFCWCLYFINCRF